MEDPYGKTVPKYMNMQGQTKFELAQSIDSALHAAEQVAAHEQQGSCYQIWFDQLSDLLQNEFLFESPVLDVKSEDALCREAETLIKRCQHQFKLSLEGASENVFQVSIKALLERGLMDALDLIQAQGIWRFAFQRNMQNTQIRLFDLIDMLDD